MTTISKYQIRCAIIRHKEPFMDARFETDDLKAVADALAKAAEFVEKKIRRGNREGN